MGEIISLKKDREGKMEEGKRRKKDGREREEYFTHSYTYGETLRFFFQTSFQPESEDRQRLECFFS